MTVHSVNLSQAGIDIPSTWLLLDSQSTVDVFANGNLLEDIHEVDDELMITSNGGTSMTWEMGTLAGYGEVWYDPSGIANIVSLAQVVKKYHVSYDSLDNVFIVTKPDGTVYKFVQAASGLYYYDLARAGPNKRAGVALVETVAAKKSNYTREDYSRAIVARELQIKIGRPSVKHFIRIVSSNQLPNCPVTREDILAAEDIFGPDIGCLKGKTTRTRPHKVRSMVLPLPPTIMDRYRNVTLCADVMHVNGIPMMVTLSRNIKFGTVEALPSRSEPNLINCLVSVARVYKQRGFRATILLIDGEFDTDGIREGVADEGMALNPTARDEHVGDVERFIRTIKERMRATHATLPFTHMPSRLVIEMAKQSVFWLHAFPRSDGISADMSPREIVTGVKLDYNKHCKYQFGQYVQTHEQTDNTMTERTIGALALRPVGNIQGSWYFLSLSTGRLLKRTKATVLPMPDHVIDHVHRMARRQKADPGLVFSDRNQVMDDTWEDDNDDSDDESYYPSDGDDDDSYDNSEDEDGRDEDEDDAHGHPDNDSSDQEGSDDELNDDQHDNNDTPVPDDDMPAPENDRTQDDVAANNDVPVPEDDYIQVGVTADDNDDTTEIEVTAQGSEAAGTSGVTEPRETPGVRPEVTEPRETPGVRPTMEPVQDEDDDDEDAEDLDQYLDSRYGRRSERYSLRERKPPGSYQYFDPDAHIFTTTGVNGGESLATAQMSMKKGLAMFGDDGVTAVRKEMRQLHDRKVMKPRDAKELTPEQRREALAYLMFLKRKRCGKVKGRGCADGRKQRKYTDPADAASPTVATESVFLTMVIDALEDRDVAIVDIPGAFMQVDMDDEEVIMRLTGKMVELLIEIDPEMYRPHLIYERGEPVLYVELLKALYGTIRAARLFWEKLSKQLMEWGFTPNPYDPCVMNRIVDGKQLTVTWHVDDLKISHVLSTVVDSFIEDLEREFGKETPLSKSRGKVHDYLGMTLDFSKPGEVTVTMIDYINMVLSHAPDDMDGTNATPAANHLFKVNSDPELLAGEQRDIFVHLTMQLLYLSQRARPDIRTAISFLCGRIQNPDMDDYKKLTRVIRYLRGTIDLPLVLSADDSGNVQWYVDASYGVHWDMKSHTGGTLTLGKGSIYSTSVKQKLMTRSSTDAEVVGVHDVLPQILWTSYFLKGQGFHVNDSILYQDNTSSMQLEKNGRASASKRSRHMNIRYFYVTDKVKSGEIRIEYCPTDRMRGDFFTKPIQGTKFYEDRDVLMNIDPSSPYHSDHRSVLRPGRRADDTDDVKLDDAANVEDGQKNSAACKKKTYLEALVQ